MAFKPYGTVYKALVLMVGGSDIHEGKCRGLTRIHDLAHNPPCPKREAIANRLTPRLCSTLQNLSLYIRAHHPPGPRLPIRPSRLPPLRSQGIRKPPTTHPHRRSATIPQQISHTIQYWCGNWVLGLHSMDVPPLWTGIYSPYLPASFLQIGPST